MRRVVVFDFDGTLTKKDTMLEFIAFVKGRHYLLWTLFLCLPHLLLMKLRLISNEKVKRRFLINALGHINRAQMQQYGECFAERIDEIIRKDIFDMLSYHHSNGDIIYIVTASMEEWVKPWALSKGIHGVMSTKMSYDQDNKFDGSFSTKNCYGKEKVLRLLAVEPNRSEYHLTAYGDSKGDREMIEFADKGIYV